MNMSSKNQENSFQILMKPNFFDAMPWQNFGHHRPSSAIIGTPLLVDSSLSSAIIGHQQPSSAKVLAYHCLPTRGGGFLSIVEKTKKIDAQFKMENLFIRISTNCCKKNIRYDLCWCLAMSRSRKRGRAWQCIQKKMSRTVSTMMKILTPQIMSRACRVI